MYIDEYYDQCLEMREIFFKSQIQDERNEILNDLVLELKRKGLSTEQIKKLLLLELIGEAQSNKQLLINNKSYMQALNKALGKIK